MTEHQMDEMRLRAIYARGSRLRSSAGCPPVESVVALVDGAADAEHGLATLDHVMNCALCKPEFELLRAGNVVNGAETRRRFLRVQLPLAFAATVAIALGATALWQVARWPGPALRGGVEQAVTLLAPPAAARVVAGVELRFVWRPAPDATAYRFELLAGNGALLRAETTRDTVLVLDAVSRASLESAAQWRVEAVRADGSRFSSEVRRLTIVP